MPWNSHSRGQADRLSVSMFVSDTEKNVEVFLGAWELWLGTLPDEDFLLLFSHLCASPVVPRHPPTPTLPFVNVYLRNSAPNANQTSNHPLSPEPVCDFSTQLCFWSLAADCSPRTTGDNANYIYIYLFFFRKKGKPSQLRDASVKLLPESFFSPSLHPWEDSCFSKVCGTLVKREWVTDKDSQSERGFCY